MPQAPPLPRLDRPDALERFRRLLQAEDFTEGAVCRRLGLDSIYDFRSRRAGRPSHQDPGDDGLGRLISLFMDGDPAPSTHLADRFGNEAVEGILALNLLGPHPDDAQALAARALVYPIASLHIASDLNEDAPGASGDVGRLHNDAVYPAIADAVQGFLADLPRTPCRHLLDLCAGTGVAALASAPRAEAVWALDITPRATHFARFNGLLNGVETLTALAGDLYQPVEGQSFDRIVAHPPYLPTLDGDLVFRDGGQDGEGVFRRIVEGLPAHLAPGGLFYGHGMATDRRDVPLEARLRTMLGSRHEEFDVYVAVSRTLSPEQFVLSRLRSRRASPQEAARHLEVLESLDVERFVQGSILIEHVTEARTHITSRRRRGPGQGWPELAWLRDRERMLAGSSTLSELEPRLTRGARVETAYRVTDEGLAGESLQITVEAPFQAAVRLPMDAGQLLPLFDGTRTVEALRREGTERGILPADLPPAEFHRLVRSLLGGGFLTLEAASTAGSPRPAENRPEPPPAG